MGIHHTGQESVCNLLAIPAFGLERSAAGAKADREGMGEAMAYTWSVMVLDCKHTGRTSHCHSHTSIMSTVEIDAAHC